MAEAQHKALTQEQEATVTQNDTLILNALQELESGKRGLAMKPTVDAVERLTGLSRNTIRNRRWALDKLKDLKDKRKIAAAGPADEAQAEETTDNVIAALRSDRRGLIEQNVLFYQEILFLREQIKKKDRELSLLRQEKKS